METRSFLSQLERGKVANATTAKRPDTGSKDQKAARHAPYSAKMPPIAGPISVATPNIAEIRPMARPHRRSGNTTRVRP